jgi:peptide/nickel transport system permease protein
MLAYILRRLLLLPVTLFFILLINFVILNMAPGEPTSQTQISQEGMAKRDAASSAGVSSDDRYLQFREFYGLTLPMLWNSWPWIQRQQVETWLWQVTYGKWSASDQQEMSFKERQDARVALGDRARFVMPKLLAIMQDTQLELPLRQAAIHFFVRGGLRQAYLGPTLTDDQKAYNRLIGRENAFLSSLRSLASDDLTAVNSKVAALTQWYDKYRVTYNFEPQGWQLFRVFTTETRFYRYLSRVLTLDFGTMRNDSNKTVLSEVTKRFKYSLTLALLPMVVTFVLCQLLGCMMALYHNRWPDIILNIACLVLYALPVFVVAPFLIEKVALHNHFPWTSTPIPLGGFSSPESVYRNMTSWQRLVDIMQHLALPLTAILYGSLAAQSRLSRTAILEVMRHDYVRTARAKGVQGLTLVTKHIGRNAAITIVTSIAGSLGVILGGSLIVETLFQIDGYGKFFYDAILNRDYNVVMFSALAGSFLALLGYLAADLAYAFLDPRVTLD